MMEPIASDGRRVFYLRTLAPGDGLDPPFDRDPYPALVWATSPTTVEQKDRLCTDLIASGCRYVVSGGEESNVWEDVADEVSTSRDLTEAERDAEHVMTTSHARETMEDVAFFFVWCTNLGEPDFTRYIVLLVGENAHVREQLIASIRECVRGER
jgi:hypothetical protein